MFFPFKKTCDIDLKSDMATHNGIFRRKIGLFEAVALIVTSTLGAGIFSLPYAISK